MSNWEGISVIPMQTYQCRFCEKKYRHRKSLSTHIKKVHLDRGETIHPCPHVECRRIYNTEEKLLNHLASSHPRNKYYLAPIWYLEEQGLWESTTMVEPVSPIVEKGPFLPIDDLFPTLDDYDFWTDL